MLEKVLIDFGKLFQRIGAVRLYERLDILRQEVMDGRSKVKRLEERVKPAALILIRIAQTISSFHDKSIISSIFL